MSAFVRQVWLAVRPITRQERFLWWCGTLLIATGITHAVVAAIDGGSWWGPVSWRKPTVFGLSFGLLLWSAVWVMRQLPNRRWGWLPAGLLGATAVVEVALITMQRWRGVPSHFNAATGFDAAIWSIMGMTIIATVVPVLVLLVWSLVQFPGAAPTRIAVLVGLLAVLAAGAIGKDMAAAGETVVETTGQVPFHIVFGAAGTPKLAHALGMHGLQVLGLLAIGLELGRLPARGRIRLMLLAAAGYVAVFAAVTVTAYAGRAWTTPALPVAAVAAAGTVGLLFAGAVTARNLLGDSGRVVGRDNADRNYADRVERADHRSP